MPSRYKDFIVRRDDDDTHEEITNETMVNFCLFVDYDPVSYEEAVASHKWNQEMEEEIHSIEKNNTWELHTLPVGKKPIGVKWVNKTKYRPTSEVDRYKARLVVKGYKQ